VYAVPVHNGVNSRVVLSIFEQTAHHQVPETHQVEKKYTKFHKLIALVDDAVQLITQEYIL
jgi:fructose/tagatose bisphosphate aldolase